MSEPSLRLLHIILSVRPTNGQYNEHCLPLLNEREISICTYFETNITVPPEITLYDGDGSLPGFFRALRRALDSREYDLIHVHTPHAGVMLMLGLLMFGRFRKMRSATVHTIQNSWQNFKPRNQLLHIPSFPLFERLVFCSHASYESFPALLKWMGGRRMRVVQNAVDLDRIDRLVPRDPANATDRFDMITVGLIPMKNPFTALEAFRQAAPESSTLTFLGEGDLRPALETEVRDRGLEGRVELPGMIDRDEVFRRFSRADLFVSTSYGEGLPVAVLEAMACGLPVVLSDIPPHREIVEGLDSVPLIDPHDPRGFAQAIREFATMSAAERAEIGRRCRRRVEARFSLPAMHAGYADVYSEVTGARVASPLEPIGSVSS